MELEELQKAWKELNERVSQNELVHQQQIIEMLSRQKESCLQRMLRMDKIASIFMLGVTILMFVDFIHLNGKLVFWPAIFGLLLYALTVNFAGVILLTKIKKETNLEMQIKNILRYKMLINWSYIIGYLLVTPFICIFLYTYRHLWWLMITMFGLILAGVLTDYFLFHHVSDRIKELTHVNKELKKHFMFQLYLLLRLKNFGRIVIELGIFRIVFLTILTVAAIMILFLAENRFAIPVVCVLLLAGYHNVRKDKEFLRTLTPHLSVFLIKEYTLIALPFAGIEIIKGQFTDAIGLWLFAALLPCLKKIKLEHKPVRLPFLYKGSYEYIRIFRQSFWVYILLFLFATAGTVHGNIKINKVCLILWGLVQASGYLQTMDNRYLLHFKNFKTLYLFQLKSIAWNVFITSIPFSLALIASTYDQDEILFFLSYYTATLIYAIGIGMLRHIIPSPLLLFIVQLSILMPFYLGSLFVPIILIPGIALTALLTCHAHKRLKRLL